ncbi:hypothetical protein PQR01_00220 [Paraburkholderia rhynchosiae]|uniref:Uncharacterized protein n=1 Tax=Paraburkholderia rhynchosiae TaxID=487049 RepID=A0ACC7N2U4_9BURK
MRAVTIEIDDGNNFTVREGERFADGLCWDEMLGTIAELTHPKIGDARYAMRTATEWAAYKARVYGPQPPIYTEPPLLEGPK